MVVSDAQKSCFRSLTPFRILPTLEMLNESSENNFAIANKFLNSAIPATFLIYLALKRHPLHCVQTVDS